MNKKLLALLLAILMVAVSACAMAQRADGGSEVVASTDINSASIVLKKTFTGTGKSTETFDFAVYEGTTNAVLPEGETVPPIAGTSITVTADKTENTGTINIPTYSYPGEYVYYITETAGSTAGVTYDTIQYKLTVTCYRSENGDLKRVASIRKQDATGAWANKVSTAEFVNTYAANSQGFTLTKELTGNAADLRDQFNFTVAFDKSFTVTTGTGEDAETKTYTLATAPTPSTSDGYTVTLSDESDKYVFTVQGLGDHETVTFTNIPDGVTWTVSENSLIGSVTKKTYQSSLEVVNGSNSDLTPATGTIGKTNGNKLTVTNTLNKTIDTGVNTDNTPYILLMALVAIMALAFVAKKRSVRE